MSDVKARVNASLGFDMEDIIEAARDAAVQAEQAAAEASFEEDRRKVVLAEQKEQARKAWATSNPNEKALTDGRAEDIARGSVPYQNQLTKIKEAKAKAGKLDSEKWRTKNIVDYALSLMATERAEMNAYGRDPKPTSEPQWTPEEQRPVYDASAVGVELPPLADFAGAEREPTMDEISDLF